MVTWEVCEAAKLDCSIMDSLIDNSTINSTAQNFKNLKQSILKPHFAHNHPFMASTIIWTIFVLALIVVCGCVAHLMRHVKKNLKTNQKHE